MSLSSSDVPGNAPSAAQRWPHRSPGSVSKAEWSGHLPSEKEADAFAFTKQTKAILHVLERGILIR